MTMLVALRDAVIEGERYLAGRTRIDAGHEVVRRHPELFAPESSPAARRILERGAQTTAGSGDEGRITLRRYVASPFRVELAHGVRGAIVEEVLTFASELSMFSTETAGSLLGVREPRRIEVGFVVPADAGARREYASVTFSGARARSLEHALAKQGRRERLLGCFHSHASDDGSPSRCDLEDMRRQAERFGGPALELIVTPSSGCWAFPHLHAWVLRESALGGYVCEPAKLGWNE